MARPTMRLLFVPVLVVSACSDGDGSGTDDRTRFFAENEGVRVEVADCFVVDVDGDRRYQTTVEVRNESDRTHEVAVTIAADLGRGGTSDTFEVPAGAADAWAVTAESTTDDPAGDVECSEYVTGVDVIVDTGG